MTDHHKAIPGAVIPAYALTRKVKYLVVGKQRGCVTRLRGINAAKNVTSGTTDIAGSGLFFARDHARETQAQAQRRQPRRINAELTRNQRKTSTFISPLISYHGLIHHMTSKDRQ